MPYCDLGNGAVLHYRASGEGRPLLLIHGWATNKEVWIYQEEAWSARHRVIAVDLRGHGRSDALPDAYEVETMGADVVEFVRRLGLRGMSIVGWAMGALVAASAAAHLCRSGALDRLVLVSPPVTEGTAAPDFAAMAEKMRRDWPRFAASTARALVRKPLSEPALQWLAGIVQSTPLSVATATIAAVPRFPALEAAAEIRVPSLVIHGTEDAISPIGGGRALASRIPGASFREIAGVGHVPFIEDREAFEEAVGRFLSTPA